MKGKIHVRVSIQEEQWLHPHKSSYHSLFFSVLTPEATEWSLSGWFHEAITCCEPRPGPCWTWAEPGLNPTPVHRSSGATYQGREFVFQLRGGVRERESVFLIHGFVTFPLGSEWVHKSGVIIVHVGRRTHTTHTKKKNHNTQQILLSARIT